jgi:geranylgeranyl diphosphate synthase type I
MIGIPMAINAGDALFALARETLSGADVPAMTMVELMRRYDRACVGLAEGQHMDLAFESTDDVSESDYISMVRRKTGALLAGAAGMGSVAGGATADSADALAEFAESLGVAFQMQDDILGLWGSEDRTGKPAGRDLQRRKKTMPVVLGLADPTLGRELRSLFRDGDPDANRAREMAARLESAGMRDRTAKEAREWSERALAALSGEELAAGPLEELQELLRRAVERDR